MLKLRMFSYVLLCFIITTMIITGCASKKRAAYRKRYNIYSTH